MVIKIGAAAAFFNDSRKGISQLPHYPRRALAIIMPRCSNSQGRCAAIASACPGLCALNFVVKEAMDGGVMASTWIDPVAKSKAQLLLDFPGAGYCRNASEFYLTRSNPSTEKSQMH